MSRGTVAVLLGLVPLIRAAADAHDAACDLARRAGLTDGGHILAELGEWELGAFVGWSFGLGFVATRRAAGSSVAEPRRTEALVYLGPLALTATRERLPEVAPLVGRAA